MSKEKTLKIEKQPVEQPNPSNTPMTEQQMQQVMRKDMEMIRLRASVLELKAIKWRMIKEMLEAEINENSVIDSIGLQAQLKEDMISLAESVLTISA